MCKRRQDEEPRQRWQGYGSALLPFRSVIFISSSMSEYLFCYWQFFVSFLARFRAIRAVFCIFRLVPLGICGMRSEMSSSHFATLLRSVLQGGRPSSASVVFSLGMSESLLKSSPSPKARLSLSQSLKSIKRCREQTIENSRYSRLVLFIGHFFD